MRDDVADHFPIWIEVEKPPTLRCAESVSASVPWDGSDEPARPCVACNRVKILVLDNYDSFTWNLVHGLEIAGGTCVVRRSDAVTLAEVGRIGAERIVLSPGPLGPESAGICSQVVQAYGQEIPILGVCLGMQVIAVTSGAQVVPSGRPIHGRASSVWHDGCGVFHGLPNPFKAARYHSLIVDPCSVPSELVVSARSSDGTILGCRSALGRVEGILFHPESFLTEHGSRIFSNFLGV